MNNWHALQMKEETFGRKEAPPSSPYVSSATAILCYGARNPSVPCPSCRLGAALTLMLSKDSCAFSERVYMREGDVLSPVFSLLREGERERRRRSVAVIVASPRSGNACPAQYRHMGEGRKRVTLGQRSLSQWTSYIDRILTGKKKKRTSEGRTRALTQTAAWTKYGGGNVAIIQLGADHFQSVILRITATGLISACKLMTVQNLPTFKSCRLQR